ncbi:MAG: hypothetical protein F6K07_33000 [Okeania sp. SIO1H5]|uniref:hypothetical protein n=1 Tax=Okeania sp. SIO1H5 TaxID=2607777 RepID=UPI0013BA9737|nr:hypothetical protein [Okeania sp. SIO1H5]NET23812.1 hypothetical protein [Okeania sp. SIO1H5]
MSQGSELEWVEKVQEWVIPGHRCWIFASSRPISVTNPQVSQPIAEMLDTWTVHGEPIEGRCGLFLDHFLIFARDESRIPISGCAMGQMRDSLRILEKRCETEILDGGRIAYLGPEGVVICSRPDFSQRIREGEIHPETTVFDLTVASTDAVIEGKFQLPLKESWHAQLFARAQTPT